MKSQNFIVIQGWMCNELNLKGNELLIFALIYGFSQDNYSSFCGGRKYIAETFNISLPTVDKALKSLIESELLIKEEGDFTRPDMYYVNMGVVKKLYGGGKETLLNNINKNINKNTISKDIVQSTTFSDDKPKKKNQFQKCLDMVNEYTTNGELRQKLMECYKLFTENSRESGKPFYANNFKGKLNVLSDLSSDVNMQIKIVEQTLKLGYNGFYELKTDNRRKTGNTTHDIEKLYGGMNDKASDKERIKNGEKF